MKATSFVIDRATWACGHRLNSSLLSDGRRCCLGFYAQACGVSDEAIRGRGDYRNVSDSVARELPIELVMSISSNWFNRVTSLHCNLVETNDTFTLSDKEREETIARLFASMGVTVTFTGEYPS